MRQVFSVVRRERPRQLDKLRAIAGDVTHPRLGIHDDERAALAGVRHSTLFQSIYSLVHIPLGTEPICGDLCTLCHHHHLSINVSTAGAQAFLMSYT
jgi:hypothetical protein